MSAPISPQKLRHSGMVDTSLKDTTKRVARAKAKVIMSQEAFRILLTKGSPKGDVFETAKVAGVLAAKLTPQLIPMCHPLELTKVGVTFRTDKKHHSVEVASEVVCLGKTGVEMEALQAVTTAALTIYDMMKWADNRMTIMDVQLIYKSGGKSGIFSRS